MSVAVATIQVKSNRRDTAIRYLKGLRRCYNNIIDAVKSPFDRNYVKVYIAYEDDNDMSVDIPETMKADIEGMSGIVRVLGCEPLVPNQICS